MDNQKINEIVKDFIDLTNKIINVYHTVGSRVTPKDDLSQILLSVREVFLRDVYLSCQQLANNKMFISLCILSRSVFDIISQLNWIIKLDAEKQKKAIDCFISFQGVGKKSNGALTYDWQRIIEPSYSQREAAKLLGDEEVINFSIKNIIQEIGPSDFEEVETNETVSLTIYDYLSKIVHWNPAILKKIVGISDDKHMGYQESEHLRMMIVGMWTFINCSVVFTEIFCQHFFESKYTNELDQLRELRNNFVQFITKVITDKEKTETNISN